MYIRARHQFDISPYRVLYGLEKPSVAVRPNPMTPLHCHTTLYFQWLPLTRSLYTILIMTVPLRSPEVWTRQHDRLTDCNCTLDGSSLLEKVTSWNSHSEAIGNIIGRKSIVSLFIWRICRSTYLGWPRDCLDRGKYGNCENCLRQSLLSNNLVSAS